MLRIVSIPRWRRWYPLAAVLALLLVPTLLRLRPAKELPPASRTHADARAGARELAAAFEAHRSNLWVESSGEVVRVLGEDRQGSPHQRFLVRVSGGPTVLVSHNIAIAPRVPVAAGSELRFRGEYEWNEKGGVVHWTHHDPDGRQSGGWIEHNGRRYQ
jgi:hypothetical protein